MLRIDLAAVREGPVAVADQIAPDDPLVKATGLALAAPLAVGGRLSTAGEGRYYWQASLDTVVRAECRRCLAPVDVPISESLGLIFVPEEEARDDEDDCYLVPRRASVLDLSVAVREELQLAVPQYVVCREDCRGLCKRCGADLNKGPCGCTTAEVDPRWETLTKLPRGE
ncbi:MAG TPA: DUF177 domain-containing protein [Gemmatimonadales bacterium]|nr:DUF177 domain-containing protein [Gemmatimonadales bacterium]